MYKPLVTWVHERLKDDKPVKATDLTDEAIDQFRKDNAFITGEFRTFLYQEIRQILALTRGPIAVTTNLNQPPLANGLVSPIISQIRWREHVGEKGYMLLPQMTRADLSIAIRERKGRMEHEGRRVLFLEAVRKGLKDAKQTVGERWDGEQLEAMRRRYEKGTADIDDRVNTGGRGHPAKLAASNE